MVDVQQKINDLSVMEQSIQQLVNQKKNFQSQLVEIESALSELGEGDSFKIIGNFMFKKSSSDLRVELEEKRDLLNIRIKSFDKQEDEAQIKFKNLQNEVLKELSDKKKVNEDG